MKKIMMMAIAATMGMAMSVNATAAVVAPANIAKAAESDLLTPIEESVDTRVMIYDDGTKMNKFVYIIGTDGTVLSKTMYSNNKKDNNWSPVCIYRAYYGENGNALYYASWDEATHSYNSNTTCTSYEKEECPVILRLPDVINY